MKLSFEKDILEPDKEKAKTKFSWSVRKTERTEK